MKYTSSVAKMSRRMISSVFHHVVVIAPVDIPARRVASNATHARVERSYSETMVFAPKAAVGITRPVNTAALKIAMAKHLVSRVGNDAKSVAFTHDATSLAANLVLPVLRKHALHVVSIPSVPHPVLPLATGCPVR
jgi:hypothetical protein